MDLLCVFLKFLFSWWGEGKKWEEPITTSQESPVCERGEFLNNYSLLHVYKFLLVKLANTWSSSVKLQ